MMFRASATPIETPTPTPPAPTAADAAATTALIDDVSYEVRPTTPSLVIDDAATNALVCVVMWLYAEAPAPLSARPAIPPPMATDAAQVTASIDAASVAPSETSPVVVVTCALEIEASMTLAMSFSANAIPIETASPA